MAAADGATPRGSPAAEAVAGARARAAEAPVAAIVAAAAAATAAAKRVAIMRRLKRTSFRAAACIRLGRGPDSICAAIAPHIPSMIAISWSRTAWLVTKWL